MTHRLALLHPFRRVSSSSFARRHAAVCASIGLVLGGCNAVLGLDEPKLKRDAGADGASDSGVDIDSGAGGAAGAIGGGGGEAGSGGSAGMAAVGGTAGTGAGAAGLGGAGIGAMGGAAGTGAGDETVDASSDGSSGAAGSTPPPDANSIGPSIEDGGAEAELDAPFSLDAPSDARPDVVPRSICEYEKVVEIVHDIGWQMRGLTKGNDGNLWAVESLKDARTARIVKISINGRFEVYPIPTANSFGQDIVQGPDGNLWFTEPVAMQLGRIEPANGHITEYPLPKDGKSWPRWVTPGSDGNIWFARSADQDDKLMLNDNPLNADSLGYINPTTFDIREFPVAPDGQNQITNLVEGPDHKMWFTEQLRIGRMTLAGVLEPWYVVPIPPFLDANNFIGLAPGPDGNMWFTGGWGDNKVGWLSTDGTFLNAIRLMNWDDNPYTHSTLPMGIIPAADGNMYFIEFLSSVIGRVNATEKQTVTEFHLSSQALPAEIVEGPDGNIWVSEFGGIACLGLHAPNRR